MSKFKVGDKVRIVEKWQGDLHNECGKMDYIVPLVQRPAKVGEWVLATKGGIYEKKQGIVEGEIYQVRKIGCLRLAMISTTNDPSCTIFEYLVLDGYQPESEYYSGKVVCTNDSTGFTAGKVYTFVDGRTVDDDGCVQPSEESCPIADLQQGWVRARNLIEFKGEVSQ